MAADANTPGANPRDPRLSSLRAREAAGNDNPPPAPPSSKPLQIFLLVALLITGAAYVVDELTEYSTEDTMARHPNRLRRLVEAQSEFITETDLGRKDEAQNKYNDAISHYRKALLGQDLAEGHLNLGNVLLKEGNPDMAFSQFKEAIRLNPDLADVYLAWGEALARQGKLDDAMQVYEDALRHNPKFAAVHYGFAKVLEQKQQAALASQHAAEVVHEQPAAAKASAEAQLYGSDAVKHYEAAERLGMNSPEFWSSYGNLLNKQGKYTEAEERLLRAVVEQPGLGPAQFQLALAQDRQGKYADAIGHYEATLAAMPDDPATLNNLALLYATATNEDVRSSKMAVLLGTRACDATTSQNALYLDTLARAYAADGDFFQAIAWEDKAVRRATQLGDHNLLREFQPRFNLFVQHRKE
jgi:tetratricopeptide (TPR) repeat protein